MVLSTDERSFNQPFNQFGVSPQYKWLTLHAGYRSLHFSEFSLADETILGGGAEVKFDWFRARSIYGRFRRSVEEDTITGVLPVFTRMGWATNIGFGGTESFIDLNVLHAWDDSTSLDRYPTTAPVYPADNLLLESNGRVAIINGQLVFDGTFAGSIMTRDQRQPSVQNSDVTALSSGITDAKISSRFNVAWKIGGTYNSEAFSLRLEFVRVDPDFQSMGASYIQNDRQDITVSPSVRLFEGSLRFGGSIGWREDNLYNDRNYTTKRIISSANANWNPSTFFGIDGQYSNYSMNNASSAALVNDTSRVENVTESYSLSPRLIFLTGTTQHFLLLFVTKQQYADRNVVNGALSANNVFTAMLNYTLSFASGLGFSSAFQFTEVQTSMLTNIIRGITLGVNKSLLENALNTSLSYTLNLTQASSESDTDRQHLLTLAALYRLSPLDAFDFRFQYNAYDAVNATRASYSGTNTRVQYTRTFALGTQSR